MNQFNQMGMQGLGQRSTPPLSMGPSGQVSPRQVHLIEYCPLQNQYQGLVLLTVWCVVPSTGIVVPLRGLNIMFQIRGELVETFSLGLLVVHAVEMFFLKY
jgi:hypothetical protein